MPFVSSTKSHHPTSSHGPPSSPPTPPPLTLSPTSSPCSVTPLSQTSAVSHSFQNLRHPLLFPLWSPASRPLNQALHRPQPFSGSSLIHFYSKFQFPYNAPKMFDEMPQRDPVCFSSVIVGLAQNSRPVDVLLCFCEMRACGFGSTEYSVLGALRASAELARLEQCRMVHAHSVVNGLDLNVVVGLVRVRSVLLNQLIMVWN
ncbi:putative tetratricopeptide-like helical domain superfamily [Helianthus annuus]|nr:putative tetratricopeptide-like helical domain superfamily [Helianthus annuus]